MNTIIPDSTSHRSRSSKIIIALLVLFLAIVGLTTVDDYGISADEKLEVQFVFWNVRLRNSGIAIPKMSEYYGSIFPFASEAVYQVKHLLETGHTDLYFDVEGSEDNISNEDFLKRIEVKHPFTFLFSLITYLAIAGIVTILTGQAWAWLGVIVLTLLPRFWGHSFFNPKDIPFATMFTLGTLAGAWLIGYYFKEDRGELKPGWNRITAYSLLYGVLVGLVTGTRIAGSFLLFFIGITHLVIWIIKKRRLKDFVRFWGLYAVMGIAWFSTVFALHPASWSNPFRWLFDGFLYLSSYEYWEGLNLFNGYFLSGQDVPWYYLPIWFGITTPVLILILSIVGAILLLIKYRGLSAKQQATTLLVFLQIGFLPGIAVLRNSVIYNAERQFLFVLPGLAVLATIALVWILGKIRSMRYQWLLLAVLGALAVPTIIDMIKLHPYEYIYFNRAFGGLEAAQDRFDTDYWGLSMREAMEWLNTHSEQDSTVVISRHYVSSEPYAAPGNKIVRIHQFEEDVIPGSYYTMVLGSYENVLGEKFANCSIVHQVLRQNVPLTIIRKCN